MYLNRAWTISPGRAVVGDGRLKKVSFTLACETIDRLIMLWLDNLQERGPLQQCLVDRLWRCLTAVNRRKMPWSRDYRAERGASSFGEQRKTKHNAGAQSFALASPVIVTPGGDIPFLLRWFARNGILM